MIPDRPYRKPSLVGRGKDLKVCERSSVKELGKFTPYLRKKGYLGQVYILRDGSLGRSQGAGSSDCLPKTQVSANAKAEV